MIKLVLFLIVCDSLTVDSAVIQAPPFRSPNRDGKKPKNHNKMNFSH